MQFPQGANFRPARGLGAGSWVLRTGRRVGWGWRRHWNPSGGGGVPRAPGTWRHAPCSERRQRDYSGSRCIDLNCRGLRQRRLPGTAGLGRILMRGVPATAFGSRGGRYSDRSSSRRGRWIGDPPKQLLRKFGGERGWLDVLEIGG